MRRRLLSSPIIPTSCRNSKPGSCWATEENLLTSTPRRTSSPLSWPLATFVGMQLRKRTLEQHIAVFGQSGSGKTVLVSSFYGGTQEPQFLDASIFDVTADDAGQGNRLQANYLGLKEARRPDPTRFQSHSYCFTLRLQDVSERSSAGPFDAVRLVWHDYPGEWFEEDVSGPTEARDRVDTFKALLGSDIAFLLVDGQRLLDHAGEEERYLKALFGSFRTGLRRLAPEILEDGKGIDRFPRIWMLALSKADLLPDLDVFGFRDLVISKAADDLEELRKVLRGLVSAPDALSVGEDFIRLSSARFEPNRIEVTERIGLDLILPVASIVPFERHVRWGEKKLLPGKLGEQFLGVAAIALTRMLSGKKAGRIGVAVAVAESFIGRGSVSAAMSAVADIGQEQLRNLNRDARARQDYMAEVLTGFRLDLDQAEKDRVLLRSRR